MHADSLNTIDETGMNVEEKDNNSMPVLLLSTRKPHISIIVDKPSTMKPVPSCSRSCWPSPVV